MRFKTVLATLKELARNGLGTPLLMVMILLMVVIPLPPLALDLFFTFNIALALVVLLVGVYALKPLEFAVFPIVLLVATLLRLALNVASTRVVLLEGHTGSHAAGRVIQAFGDFVVGGNYAVGLVVFAILVIINFVVVTKGAGRISEVSARFTLDALPGKQMAIDADLNAGLISQDEARSRRDEIAQEADFYGAMDGASKFVRGDAIAGMLILFINIIGGLAIGTLQHGLPLSTAFENYSLLTIGDGLVAQIPSLLLSTAAAMMVTRVSSSADVGDQVVHQLLGNSRALAVTAAIIGLLGLIPGMPNVPFIVLAVGVAGLAYAVKKRKQMPQPDAVETVEEGGAGEEPGSADVTWDDIDEIDPIGLEVGYRLVPLVDVQQNGLLLGRIRGVRKKLSRDLGFLVPPVHIKDNLELSPETYRITLRGVGVAQAEVYPDRDMAINPGHLAETVEGLAGKDPAFGLDAVWVEPGNREHAQILGYTVVDASTVVATHVNQVLLRHAHQLLGYDEVQRLFDRLAESAPKLVEDLVPKTVPLRVVCKVLQNLLREEVPIRDMRTIAESLAEHGAESQDPDALTARARIALGATIINNINGLEEGVEAVVLDPPLERLLHQGIQGSGNGAAPMEPGLAERIHKSLCDIANQREVEGKSTVLLVADAIRPFLARFMRGGIQGLHVLSFNEIPDNQQIKVVATVGG